MKFDIILSLPLSLLLSLLITEDNNLLELFSFFSSEVLTKSLILLLLFKAYGFFNLLVSIL
jgi:hypothetical protein